MIHAYVPSPCMIVAPKVQHVRARPPHPPPPPPNYNLIGYIKKSIRFICRFSRKNPKPKKKMGFPSGLSHTPDSAPLLGRVGIVWSALSGLRCLCMQMSRLPGGGPHMATFTLHSNLGIPTLVRPCGSSPGVMVLSRVCTVCVGLHGTLPLLFSVVGVLWSSVPVNY